MTRGRPPRCFQRPEDAAAWLRLARYASPGSSAFCADCTACFQREMIGKGLCDHPDVFFVLDEDGTEVGVKPENPAQMPLFEAA